MTPDAGDREWLRVRRRLQRDRYELGVHAGRTLYPGTPRVAGTPLLTAPHWTPAAPVPMDDVALEHGAAGTFDVREPRYSSLMARLARPAVFENRPTYRLLGAVLDDGRPRMRFGDGRYFDGVDTGEALAHEYAADGPRPLRDALGDPVDPARRPVNVAISAVTIRCGGEPTFLVHRRDPARVGHAGGLLQVLPVGVFQPVTAASARHDFSLRRCLQRELAEELLGHDEATGTLDYDASPFGPDAIRPYVLGMGVDPLTLATDVLCAVVVDERLVAAHVAENAEGTVSEHPFTADVVQRFVRRERMQAAGAATLTLAWRYRELLLSRTRCTRPAPRRRAR